MTKLFAPTRAYTVYAPVELLFSFIRQLWDIFFQFLVLRRVLDERHRYRSPRSCTAHAAKRPQVGVGGCPLAPCMPGDLGEPPAPTLVLVRRHSYR